MGTYHVKTIGYSYEDIFKKNEAAPERTQSLQSSQVAHKAGAYPRFCSMKRLGVFPLDGMLVHRRVSPSRN